jgi:cysteine desulfuration protein SufE
VPIPSKLQEYLEDLAIFSDRQDHIEYLIALADDYKHPDALSFVRTEEKKVPGCESEVFIEAVPDGDSLTYRFAVDNPQGISAMAMAAILQSSLSGASRADIVEVSEDIVFKIFGNELSMGKNLGLTNMVRIVKRLAEKA